MENLLKKPFFIGSLQIRNRLLMAPMCGITHYPFRKACQQFGAGLTYTQMVSAKALTMGDQKTKQFLSYQEHERPLAFQIFGNNEHDLSEAAHICEDMGANLVDLNMGCPAKKIVNDGGGSALLKDSALARKIFQGIRKRITIPFTIKMRAGWDKEHDTLEIAKQAEQEGVNAITLHARTKTQGYSGKSDWALIKHYKESLSIPVIGNGDVRSSEDAHRITQQTGCDAVMIGRQGFAQPWIFSACLQDNPEDPKPSMQSFILKQYEDFFSFYGIENGIKQMRKYLCAYSKGMRQGAQFRNDIVRLTHWPDIEKYIQSFFSTENHEYTD